jgi:hypothetical protein
MEGGGQNMGKQMSLNQRKQLELLRAQNNAKFEPKPAPHSLLAMDPGKSTGWCYFIDGYPDARRFGIHRNLGDLIDWLESIPNDDYLPDLILVEEFTLYKQKALQQSGSKMETSQAVGAIEYYARRHKIPVVYQKAEILKIASMWSGVDHNVAHNNSHHLAAYNHGLYWLVQNGMREIP